MVLHTPKLLSNAYLCLSHSCLILSPTPTTNHHGIWKQYGPLELLHLIRQSVHYDFKRERTQSRSWCSPLSLKCFRCTFYSCYVFIYILYYLHMLLCHFRLSLGTLPKHSHSLQRQSSSDPSWYFSIILKANFLSTLPFPGKKPNCSSLYS